MDNFISSYSGVHGAFFNIHANKYSKKRTALRRPKGGDRALAKRAHRHDVVVNVAGFLVRGVSDLHPRNAADEH